MAQELAVVQTELQMMKQQNEILTLRQELQHLQAKKATRLEDSLFAPSLFEHYRKISEFMSTSELIPVCYRKKPTDIFIAMSYAYQLGMPIEQSLQDIAVINGRPCLWGDGMLSLIIARNDCVDVVEEPIYKNDKIFGWKCTVKRLGKEEHSQTFTLDDANNAGLLAKKGTWSAYTSRMLQLRARAFALRDRFPDALRGIKMAEEVADYAIDGEVINSNDAKVLTQTEKVKEKIKGSLNNEYSKTLAAHSQDDDVVVSIDALATRDTKAVEEKELAENGLQATETVTKASRAELIQQINDLTSLKNFSEERFERALDYFQVTSLDELTHEQAEEFVILLQK